MAHRFPIAIITPFSPSCPRFLNVLVTGHRLVPTIQRFQLHLFPVNKASCLISHMLHASFCTGFIHYMPRPFLLVPRFDTPSHDLDFMSCPPMISSRSEYINDCRSGGISQRSAMASNAATTASVDEHRFTARSAQMTSHRSIRKPRARSSFAWYRASSTPSSRCWLHSELEKPPCVEALEQG